MVYTVGSMQVEFDLKPGVYNAWPDSAEGKTYTAKLLRAIEDDPGVNILVLSYDNTKGKSEEMICDMIFSNTFDLIFVDRADLYVTPAICNALYASKAIVYLDCKHNTYADNVGGADCVIDFTDKGIRYYVDSF